MSRAKRERGRASPEAVSKTTDLLLAPFAGELLETIETPVVLLDRTGAIMQFNAAACALTGYAAGEVIGRKVWDFLIPQEEIKAVKAVFAKTRRSEFPTHFVNDWLTRAQERRRLKWSNTVLHDAEGNVAYVLATGIDITEELRAAQKLADREAFLASVINTAPAAVITIDEAGGILSFSPSAEKLFGYRQADITGQKIDRLMPEPYRPEHERYVRRYLETGEARIIGRKRPMTALRRDGGSFPVLLSVGEFTQSGRRYFVGFIEDITAEEEARRKLEETRAQLQHASRASMAGEMAAAIAHEVSQPLTAAVSFAEAADLLLEKDGRGADEAARGMVRQCGAEMRRAGKILQGIRASLDYGYPEKRKQNLNDVVREAATLAFVRERHGKVALRLHLAKQLPPV
ncbi:MAG: PAS domain S-box protein, partial [Alphaproteobacteria bacterium]